MSAILDQYGLNFYKRKSPYTDKFFYYCDSKSISNRPLSSHLSSFGKGDVTEALGYIRSIENNTPLIPEADFVANDATEVRFVPPNAIIDENNQNYSILITDLKQIYLEWLDFLNT